MLWSVPRAAWGMWARQIPPFRVKALVGRAPPLGFRSLVAATTTVWVCSRGEAFFLWPAGWRKAVNGYLDLRMY